MKNLRFLLLWLSCICLSFFSMAAIPERPNVLFIAVDDLRPELGCYGKEHILSPNIDRLAREGMLFTNAYCNVPVCGASRASLLSGVRPDINRFVDYYTYLDNDMPGTVSLPMHFKNNGYQSLSIGKVFHHQDDGKGSWSENWKPEFQNTSWLDYQGSENIKAYNGPLKKAMPYEKADVNDDQYFDGKIATKAIASLKAFQAGNEPFFLAVGFLKPHLPFNAPKKYWDLYDEKKIQLAKNPFAPDNAPVQAFHNFGELRAYLSVPSEGPVPDSLAHRLIHGYYACVSYVDAQIGRVLDALKTYGLDENTIVVLWGDHGWQLGEHGLWCKHCNFKNALHTPLIVKVPGVTDGSECDDLVEYVDVYPTLTDLTGLTSPFHLQGTSMVELLKGNQPDWKQAVFARWHNGETIITSQYAYTEWHQTNSQKVVARMLYDHRCDPEENNNVAEDRNYQKVVDELSRKLKEHIQSRNFFHY